ncbi:MAG TPA: RNA polymerase sigma factor [Patescibacteria group bacterium]|nr:RNA polymerase sigma factor [Patescibacteria group bacterium]
MCWQKRTKHLTEQEAIKKIVAGDSEAFGVLYDMYIERIYRFVYFRTHHKQTAEDLTSIVFTKAFSKFGSFDTRVSFSTWIFSIARNTCIDFYRTAKPVADLETAPDVAEPSNLARDYELREKVQQVKAYLETLAPDQRELVIMRLWEGFSYDEIARITGKKSANLRVTFSRIIARMQKEITFALILFAIIFKKYL